MIEAMIPKGISSADKVRDSRSITIRKLLPNIKAAGSKYRLSDPMIKRAIWGTTNPIQPINPVIETTVAVSSVAESMTTKRNRCTCTPIVWASSSPNESTFSRQDEK